MQGFLLKAPSVRLCFNLPLFCLDSDLFFLNYILNDSYSWRFFYMYIHVKLFPHTYQLPIVTLVTTRNETFLLSHSITADPSTTFNHPKSLLHHKKKKKKKITHDII